MILADKDMRYFVEKGDLIIDPYDDKFVQPASYDVHLSKWFRGYPLLRERRDGMIDVKSNVPRTTLHQAGDAYEIWPGEFVLASTIEKVKIPNFLCARLEGKSSLGRIGLTVHVTAGFIDPGFHGHITLELANLNNRIIRLYPGMPIGQLSFQRMTSVVSEPYGEVAGSKYQDQEEAPVESQYWKNFPDKFLESS